MHSSMGMLLTVIERVRGYLDDPVVNAKYDNQFIVDHIIGTSMGDVYSRLNQTTDNPVLIRYSIPLVAGQEYYQLPSMVGSVWRLAMVDAQGAVWKEFLPRGVFHAAGPGWELQENLLVVRPYPSQAETIEIWYMPSGHFLPHYADDGLMSADGLTMTLSADPELGRVDRRSNAYAGAILRLLPTTGMIEERVIESHDVCNETVTVRVPFTSCGALPDSSSSSSSSGPDTEKVVYEIAPAGSQGIYEAITCRSILKLAAYRNISQKQREFFKDEYKSAIKTLRDTLTNMQLRTGKYFQKHTVDNQDYWVASF